MEGPLSFFLFFFVVVPFVLMNMTAYIKDRKKADEDARQEPLDRRSDDDPGNLRAHFGREPRRQAVEDPEEAAEQRCEYRFLHLIPPPVLLHDRGADV